MNEKPNDGARGAAEGAKSAAPKEAAAEASKVKLVKMERIPPYAGTGPTSADVHPDEVANWSAQGWKVSG